MPNRPTILQVLPALESGGVERGTVEIATAIKAHGWRAIVASNGGAMEAELEASDVVDANGWCARCDCDARVERVDAGRPGRYVGKSSAMVLRGVTTTGREVSVKAW